MSEKNMHEQTPVMRASSEALAWHHHNFCWPHEILRLETGVKFTGNDHVEEYAILVMRSEEADKLPIGKIS